MIFFMELWLLDNEKNEEVLFFVQYFFVLVSVDFFELGNCQFSYFGFYQGGLEVVGDVFYCMYNFCFIEFVISLFIEDDVCWEGIFMLMVYDCYFDFYDVDDFFLLDIFYYYVFEWVSFLVDEVVFNFVNFDVIFYVYGIYGVLFVSSDYEMILVKKFDDFLVFFGEKMSMCDIVLVCLGDIYFLVVEVYL